MNIDSLLKISIEASVKAGQAIMTVYKEADHGIEIKKDNSFLTKADKLAHAIIEECLKNTGIPVLSEEGKEIPFDVRKNWERLWIVDPLDGTKEFINRNGEFTVNIALVENQIPVLGVVYCPAQQVLYFASKDFGSYKLTLENVGTAVFDLTKAAKLPLCKYPEVYTVVASRSHISEETLDFINELEAKHGRLEMISKGSSLKFCLMAEGSAHCYPRFAPTMEWDTAAGHAVCKYAGLTVTDWVTQKEKTYNNPELLNNWFVVKDCRIFMENNFNICKKEQN
ncbi:MAG: 3'(2'),5'-bisphosphate nucleotidase CysQ [Flavobacterium sp.]